MRSIIISLVVALVFSGCATVNTLQPGTGSTFEVREKSYSEIWKAVVRTASSQLTIVENNKDSGNLKAENDGGENSWGEVVGIFVRPAKEGAEVYTVEVQSLKRSKIQINGKDWTLTMMAGIKTELDQ